MTISYTFRGNWWIRTSFGRTFEPPPRAQNTITALLFIHKVSAGVIYDASAHVRRDSCVYILFTVLTFYTVLRCWVFKETLCASEKMLSEPFFFSRLYRVRSNMYYRLLKLEKIVFAPSSVVYTIYIIYIVCPVGAVHTVVPNPFCVRTVWRFYLFARRLTLICKAYSRRTRHKGITHPRAPPTPPNFGCPFC